MSSKFHWGVKTKHILRLFTMLHFLKTRLTFDIFLRFSFTFKNVNFEFPQNWILWVLLLRKSLALTKARSRFLEMPHGEKLQNVFSFYTPMTFWIYSSDWQGWLSQRISIGLFKAKNMVGQICKNGNFYFLNLFEKEFWTLQRNEVFSDYFELEKNLLFEVKFLFQRHPENFLVLTLSSKSPPV